MLFILWYGVAARSFFPRFSVFKILSTRCFSILIFWCHFCILRNKMLCPEDKQSKQIANPMVCRCREFFFSNIFGVFNSCSTRCLFAIYFLCHFCILRHRILNHFFFGRQFKKQFSRAGALTIFSGWFF